MKRLFLFLISVFCLCGLNSFAFVRYVTANLNLRYGPGTKYSVIAVIPQGTAVTIDEDCNCRWVPVEYNGMVGYISTKYLSSVKVKTPHKSYANKSYTRGTRYYANSYGNRVQSPTYYNSRPAGATALCRDGTYSFSQSRRGTCSHHGGVAQWLR